MYLKCDLKNVDLKIELGGKFDVILIDPPFDIESTTSLNPSSSSYSSSFYSWSDVLNLPIEDIASQRSFVFLWIDENQGLDLGRQCFKKWGFRRCEDIVWLKTNNSNRSKKTSSHNQHLLFQRTKQHCLMGIKGTVRRSTDTEFINANIDIDLIIREEETERSNILHQSRSPKPEELFNIIEHFCLGKRRLHLFARDSDIRNGWLSVGHELTNSNFNKQAYWSFFSKTGHLTGTTERIEALRPKSPPPFKMNKSNERNQNPSQRQVRSKNHLKSLVTLPPPNAGHRLHRQPSKSIFSNNGRY
jgi:mRNA (2'-O-methyladenosine-N6-)-methyltransferase